MHIYFIYNNKRHKSINTAIIKMQMTVYERKINVMEKKKKEKQRYTVIVKEMV